MVARAKTRAQTSRAARRAHGAQEPTAAKGRYTRALVRLTREMWATILGAIGMPARERRDDLKQPTSQLFDHVRVQLYRMVDGQAPPILERAGDDVSEHNGAQMKRLVGFDPRIDPALGPALRSFRSRNVALIKSIADDQLSRVRETLEQNFGLSVKDLATKLEEEFGATRSKAELIARDQTLKLNGELTQARQQGAGIDSYIWTTSNDERVRESHADQEGEIFRWDNPPPETGHPGRDFQCRCTPFPIIPELDDGS
jgi:SPP1 gp7 family putative phage head morphogenesis protein